MIQSLSRWTFPADATRIASEWIERRGGVSKVLVKQFKFKRNNDKGGFQWMAHSSLERPGFYRGFTGVGRTLADVKEFAALVRWCERTGTLERLSEMHPPGYESRLQTTWGGNWYPQRRGSQ